MQRSGLSHEPRIYWSCIPPVRGYRYGPPGAGIDDLAAVSLFAKRVNRGLHAPDHPFDVDVVDLVDNLRRDGFDGRRRRNPGIIHNHVETTQRGAGFLNRRKHRSRSETSTFTAMALPPLRMISSATARAVSSLKSAIATAKPSFTGRSAIALPIPGLSRLREQLLHFSVLIVSHKIWLRWSWPISSGLSL